MQNFRSCCCHHRAKLQKLLLPSSYKASQALTATIVQSFRNCGCHHHAKLHKFLLQSSCKAPQALTAIIVQSFRNCCCHHHAKLQELLLPPSCKASETVAAIIVNTSQTVAQRVRLFCVSSMVFQKLPTHSVLQLSGGLTSLLLHTNNTDTTDNICLNKHSETFVEGTCCGMCLKSMSKLLMISGHCDQIRGSAEGIRGCLLRVKRSMHSRARVHTDSCARARTRTHKHTHTHTLTHTHTHTRAHTHTHTHTHTLTTHTRARTYTHTHTHTHTHTYTHTYTHTATECNELYLCVPTRTLIRFPERTPVFNSGSYI